jgi:hypothetical protein
MGDEDAKINKQMDHFVVKCQLGRLNHGLFYFLSFWLPKAAWIRSFSSSPKNFHAKKEKNNERKR